VEAEARVDIAGDGSESGSAASLADERVTLEDMSVHSEGSIVVEGVFGMRRKGWVDSNLEWPRGRD
jgi:hypothetical protein